jgi:2-oxoglutarate dehydrogenase E1 component
MADKLPETGVSMETLTNISDAISTAPKEVSLHGGLKRVLKGRAALAKDQLADWAMGESFGYGSLLMDGKFILFVNNDSKLKIFIISKI